MTSKEALERLCSRCYIESEQCTCHPRYKGGVCYTSCEYKEAIEQDLDKLEKLEKAFKIFIEKDVEVNWLMTDSLEMYNAGLDKKYQLTQEQYSLLKEVLGND